MKQLWNKYQLHKDIVLVLAGLLVVSMITLPYLVLGEGSYVQVHDQLDGEVVNYIYQARYLGQGNVIPQFMNGMDKASMLPPAPLGVLLYKIFPPFMAFAMMHWLCLVVGFLGMYSLEKRLGLTEELSWIVACLFCYIPFYPVYGLAALGQPMLVLCGLQLREGKTRPGTETPPRKSRRGDWGIRRSLLGIWRFLFGIRRSLLGISLYAAGSSLTLVGYAWVGMGLLWMIGLLISSLRKRGMDRKECISSAWRIGGGVLLMVVVYLLTNLDLLRSLGGNGFTTHRQEMVLHALTHPVAQLQELFLKGGAYSPVYSPGILAGLLLITCVSLFNRCKHRNQNNQCLTSAWKLTGIIFLGVLLAVLWNCSFIVELRQKLGGMITYFQADRIYWIFPFAWTLVLGYTLEGIRQLGCMLEGIRLPRCTDKTGCSIVEEAKKTDMEVSPRQLGISGRTVSRKEKTQVAVTVTCCAILIAIEGLQILRDSTLNKNIRLMLSDSYSQVTWECFYMEDVFDRIDEAIGDDKERYSMVSLGIHPSVALYNGYTCADGYSNNYDLTYKHLFRQIMAEELEENEETKAYFDDWGNRLYLAGAPYGINGMVSRGQAAYTDLNCDLDAMYDLNIRYIFAAAPIELSPVSLEQTSLHLELVEGSPFSDDTSYYEVWLYHLTQ